MPPATTPAICWQSPSTRSSSAWRRPRRQPAAACASTNVGQLVDQAPGRRGGSPGGRCAGSPGRWRRSSAATTGVSASASRNCMIDASSARRVAVVEAAAGAGDGEQRLPGERHRRRQVDEQRGVLEPPGGPGPRPAPGSGRPSTASPPCGTAGSARSRAPRSAVPSGRSAALHDPGVLRPAALGGVHHVGAPAPGHPGQPAGGDVAGGALQGEGAQVDAAGLEAGLAHGRRARQLHDRLGHPAPRVGPQPLPVLVERWPGRPGGR